MKCAKCFIEYDNGEVIAPIDESALDEASEIGLGFCVMCVPPAGNPAQVQERIMDETTEPTCGCGSCGCGKKDGIQIEKKVVSEMDGVSQCKPSCLMQTLKKPHSYQITDDQASRESRLIKQ